MPYISPSGVKTRRWVCRCDCGKEIVVLRNALTAKKNPTTSCGCTRRGSQMKDLTGQRFGRLTVLETAPLPKPEPNGSITGWRCRCDCGKEVVVSTKALRSGLQSCGCLLADTAREKVDKRNVLGRYQGTVISAIRSDRPANANSSSGVKGVYWNEREGRWIAKIGVKGKTITIGRFSSLEAAAAARKAAEDEYFKPLIEQYEEDHHD